MPRPSHPLWFDHPNNNWWSYSLCSLIQYPFTSSLWSPDTLLSTLFSNTLNLWGCYSLGVRDKVSHPYKTTGKMMALYILIFMLHNHRGGWEKHTTPMACVQLASHCLFVYMDEDNFVIHVVNLRFK
jgi:hypothetical protein